MELKSKLGQRVIHDCTEREYCVKWFIFRVWGREGNWYTGIQWLNCWTIYKWTPRSSIRWLLQIYSWCKLDYWKARRTSVSNVPRDRAMWVFKGQRWCYIARIKLKINLARESVCQTYEGREECLLFRLRLAWSNPCEHQSWYFLVH